MPRKPALAARRPWQCLTAGLVLALAAACVHAQVPSAAKALRDRYVALQGEFLHSEFGRPLRIDSSQNAGNLSGEVYAVVNHPFAKLERAFVSAPNWCDIPILHPNVKSCRTVPAPPGTRVVVHIGTKHAQRIENASRVDFDFRVLGDSDSYLRVALGAGRGPLGTRDYRITLEAVPLEGQRSLVHLSYAYGYGTMAQLAMQGYLATIGRGKVGFSVIGRTEDGRPVYVGDVRGVMERNTMRYFLAIDAYLDSLDLPPQEQVQRRLREWFAATERYATQLHEVSEREYLEMKRVETGLAGPLGAAPAD